MATIDNLIRLIKTAVLDPLIAFMFALAMVVFLWGGFQFIWGGADPAKREEGRKHLIWGVVGMFIMVSVYGILNIIVQTLGVSPRW